MSPVSQRLVFIDHSGIPGGGQLGLKRYLLQPSPLARVVIFITGGSVAEELKSAGVDVRVLFPDRQFTPALAIRSAARLRRALRAIGPSHVVVNSAYAAIPASLSVPSSMLSAIYYLRTEMGSGEKRWKHWVENNFIYSRFDGFITNSEWTRGTISATLKGRPSRVAYPLSGISASDKEGRIPAFSEATTPIRVATLSRLDAWKGIDLVIDALTSLPVALHPDVTLDVYGGSVFSDGEYEKALRANAKAAPFSVRFHGHVQDVSAPLRQTDLLILPSRAPEPFGQVVAQGLSHGCVVIVSAHGGAVEQVKDGLNGLTFRPGDALHLSAQISRLLSKRSEARALTDGAKQFAEQMDDGRLALNLEEALAELWEEAGRARRGHPLRPARRGR